MSQETQDLRTTMINDNSLEEKLEKFFEEFRKAVMRQSCRWRAFEEPTLVELWHELDRYEATLKHAVVRTINVEVTGSRHEHAIHYLSCKKCLVRRILGLPKDSIEWAPKPKF